MSSDNAALPPSTEETDQLHRSNKKKHKKSSRDIVMHESRTGEFLDDVDVSEDDFDGDVDLKDDPECPTIRLSKVDKRVLR
ncbi:hypothetical protein GH714_034733 [Hevea brasiliensis]|uniref:Uncharacterized protein n=1 Tax=Hevea brasiliensis TaxID=3981 RepID=A0A6A6M703_HEVBR|nr:hypothetical protein GH714_034733 [Hevea brasiliensis]